MLSDVCSEVAQIPGVQSAEVEAELKIDLKVLKGDQHYDLSVEFDKAFPNILPTIVLKDARRYGLLPHICWKSIICYDEGEGNSIDTCRPEAVAVYAIEKAISHLPEKSSPNTNPIFYLEYEGYWARQSGALSCNLFFEPSNSFSEIRVLENPKTCHPFAIFNNDIDRNSFRNYGLNKKLIKGTEMKGYFLPLKRVVDPPLPGEPLKASFLNDVFQALSTTDFTKWNAVLDRGQIPNRLTILLSQPRDKQSKSIYAIHLPPKVTRQLRSRQKLTDDEIIPISIDRHYLKYLSKRGGLGGQLHGKRLAIVGCGSLGSHIADLCVKSGITNLVLIDGDILKGENLFRHVLGSESIYENKAEALCEYFNNQYYGLTLEYETRDRIDISDLIARVDGIVIAIGDPTQERAFNQELLKKSVPKSVFMLTSWLEADGVGGHAIMSETDKIGCLHCLYHIDNTFQLSRKTDFIRPGQVATRNLVGCGGGHIAFGAVHAQKTAVIAVEMLLNRLTERSTKSNYQNWLNENLETQLELSEFSKAKQRNEGHLFYPDAEEGCPICRRDESSDL